MSRISTALPVLRTGPQNLQRGTTDAWRALLRFNGGDPRVFRRGGLCRIEHDDGARLRIRQLNPDGLRHEMAKAAQWRCYKTDGGWKVAKPDLDIIRNMLASPDPPLPVLKRIVEVPVFSSHGELVVNPGYDASSQIYYNPVLTSMKRVSKQPTTDELTIAKDLIVKEALEDFPFVEPADRAHAVGLLFLPFVREMIAGPTPNHLIESPTPGSGKGLLATVSLLPALGTNLASFGQVRGEDEMRKRITACLRQGCEVIFLDNLTGPLDSGVLASALTTSTWEDRVLGQSQTVAIPVSCVWVTSANNPVLSTEIARRSIRIRVDSEVERPWLRNGFRHPNLTAWAAEHRTDLVWAVLTLVQHWQAQGEPEPQRRLGSYEEWSRVVGGILEAAGIPGFLGNLDAFYEVADLENEKWRQLIDAWHREYGEQEVTTNNLMQLAECIEDFNLVATCRPAVISFGKQLAQQRDRVFNGYRVIQTRTVRRAARWRLIPVRQPGCECSEGG